MAVVERSIKVEDKIRKSYEKVNISDSAKNRIQMAIMLDDSCKKGEKTKMHTSTWKIAVAACISLALILPTGVYAAQKIYQHFTTSFSEKKQSVDIKMQSSESESDNGEKATNQVYLKVSADFGEDYTLSKKQEYQKYTDTDGTVVEVLPDDEDDAMIEYQTKEGFYGGKCFWYKLYYLGENVNSKITRYNTAQNKVFTINGYKAIYSKTNDVVGSKYSSDYILNQGQDIFIFLEDYGYMLAMSAQNGLSKDEFINLAKKIKFERVNSADEASIYADFDENEAAGWSIAMRYSDEIEEIGKAQCHDKTANYKNCIYTVKDVKILDSIKGLKKDAFMENMFARNLITDENGKIKKYERETVQYGDGVDEPETKVTGSQDVQPKLVYITLEVENSSSIGMEKFYLPSLQLVQKKDGKIIKKYFQDNYNRPKYINNAFMDSMPCYFEETLGGKSGYATKASTGKLTLHLAYMVDEDMLDGMMLDIMEGVIGLDPEEYQYIDISQK